MTVEDEPALPDIDEESVKTLSLDVQSSRNLTDIPDTKRICIIVQKCRK